MSYYETACFPISQLKSKIVKDLYPFTRIQSKQIVKKDRKNRLQITLLNRNNDRKQFSFLLSVQYAAPPSASLHNGDNPSAVGVEKNKYYINTQSFENAVAAHKKMVNMQNELDAQLFEDLDLGSGDGLSRNPDDLEIE